MKITILGATGSIGQSTLAVIAQQLEQFEVFALTANQNYQQLFAQCRQFQPRYAVMVDATAAAALKAELQAAAIKTEVLVGAHALHEVAADAEVDCVVAAIVGAAGLLPTLAAIHANKKVLLANKEALVMSGELMTKAVQRSKAALIPVDSEHNAIFQCLPTGFKACCDQAKEVASVALTASGGPFLTAPLSNLATVTPEQAIAHPTWSMGAKISVDSATMVNKGLEVIEAHWLFNLAPSQIDVVIHPQSTVHSVVNYIDGSMLAQLGASDMRVPIANALAWPQRVSSGVAPLNLATIKSLSFLEVDQQRFPALKLAYAALQAGGAAPCYFNAANEIAVAAFLNKQIAFTQIVATIAHVLDQCPVQNMSNLESVLAADALARRCASEYCRSNSALFLQKQPVN